MIPWLALDQPTLIYCRLFFSDFAKMALDESNHLWVTWWDTYLSIYLLLTHIMTGTSWLLTACKFTHRSGICNYDIWFPLRSSGNRTSGCAKHKDLMSTITSWHLWINGVLTCPWIIRSSTKSKWNWALDSHLKRLLALPWNWDLRTRLDLIRAMIPRQRAPLWVSIDIKKGRWWEAWRTTTSSNLMVWWNFEGG